MNTTGWAAWSRPLIRWQASDYVDLDREQKRYLNAAVADLLAENETYTVTSVAIQLLQILHRMASHSVGVIGIGR